MKIDSFKDLQKLIKLCRTTGVEAIEIDGIKMNLGSAPVYIQTTKKSKRDSANAAKSNETPMTDMITGDMKIPTDGLTEEQLLMWSAEGHAPVDEKPPQ